MLSKAVGRVAAALATSISDLGGDRRSLVPSLTAIGDNIAKVDPNPKSDAFFLTVSALRRPSHVAPRRRSAPHPQR
jgi:hypothetical protein